MESRPQWLSPIDTSFDVEDVVSVLNSIADHAEFGFTRQDADRLYQEIRQLGLDEERTWEVAFIAGRVQQKVRVYVFMDDEIEAGLVVNTTDKVLAKKLRILLLALHPDLAR
jgi:hypothetical protein